MAGRSDWPLVTRGRGSMTSRWIASGSPETRRKGLDKQVERSPSEAVRPGGEVYIIE